jgi:hypothetical protein
MAKPTEQDKKAKKTKDVTKGKIRFGEVETEVDITTETTPNANGGYDTVVTLPECPITAVKET